MPRAPTSSPSSTSSDPAGAPAACGSLRRPARRPRSTDDLTPDDFLRRAAPRYGAFDAIWVFTPEIVEPEGRLWIRLAQQGATLVVVVSFHPENFYPEDTP